MTSLVGVWMSRAEEKVFEIRKNVLNIPEVVHVCINKKNIKAKVLCGFRSWDRYACTGIKVSNQSIHKLEK